MIGPVPPRPPERQHDHLLAIQKMYEMIMRTPKVMHGTPRNKIKRLYQWAQDVGAAGVRESLTEKEKGFLHRAWDTHFDTPYPIVGADPGPSPPSIPGGYGDRFGG